MNVGSPFHKTRDLLNIREEIIVRRLYEYKERGKTFVKGLYLTE